jgi:hypothetical protein
LFSPFTPTRYKAQKDSERLLHKYWKGERSGRRYPRALMRTRALVGSKPLHNSSFPS